MDGEPSAELLDFFSQLEGHPLKNNPVYFP